MPLMAQSNSGELRIKVAGPDALPLKATVELSSDALSYHRTFASDENGELAIRNLLFAKYHLKVQRESFSSYEGTVEIRSALPLDLQITLNIAALSTAVHVTAETTLIDPERASTVNHIDSKALADRPASLPGRSLPDLVNSQPGWLYEGNAVLHPRGSEYQTQFVIDGIPLTDNRSPSFGPAIEADDVDSMTIYTAGIPAEYGRKMGGIIEVNTQRDATPGLHGNLVLSGGSFATAGAFASAQETSGRNTFAVSASGNGTSRYLNPVVPENYTNRGTTGDFSAGYDRDLTTKDRLSFSVRHEFSRYEIPNELLQQFPAQQIPPGVIPQLQTAGNVETMGTVAYQHIFSENLLANFRGMVRDNADTLNSNQGAWPIAAFLNNDFKEGYFHGSVSVHHRRHEWKAGFESDNLFLHEQFHDTITASPGDPYDPFAPGTPATFSFAGSRPDLEQSAYIQDLVHLGKFTVSAGLRWDHYQLVVNQNAVSPRFAVSRYFADANLMVHASYDRVFQTPSSENILLACSPDVTVLNPDVLRLPVKPSHGNYFEVGATRSWFGQFRADVNYFRRYVDNFADDDQILSTAVTFPIAFRKAVIYGAEAKLELPRWQRFSSFLSYSYIVGNVWAPVTGGLFIGDDAVSAQTQLSGHFPDSQDQRHTLRGRARYQLASHVWLAAGAEYGSGLPVAFAGTPTQAVAEYGSQVVSRVDFNDGRVRPNLSVDLSAGADLYQKEKRSLRLQGDVENLSNRLNVIDFAGLFSGNAIAPPRSYFLRMAWTF